MNARSRHLGENLRRLREARGWTQARLSAESGVGQPTLSGIERGRNGASLRKIEMLAVALGAELSSLMFPRTCGTCAGATPRGFICQECGCAGEPPAAKEPTP